MFLRPLILSVEGALKLSSPVRVRVGYRSPAEMNGTVQDDTTHVLGLNFEQTHESIHDENKLSDDSLAVDMCPSNKLL
jgi:hypothetical protein